MILIHNPIAYKIRILHKTQYGFIPSDAKIADFKNYLDFPQSLGILKIIRKQREWLLNFIKNIQRKIS